MEQKNNSQKSKSKNQSKVTRKKSAFPPVYLEEMLDQVTKQRLLDLKNKSSK